ncbi:MAG: SPFH domain-containing protein [Thermoanaerobaculia bacterium]|nr:SPFH domain-containing protein [Thermoanaerobaculia bacterium]
MFLAKGDDRKDLGRRLWDDVLRPAFRYGFSDLLDDLAFWLVIGLGVAGVLAAALPDNLGELGLGSGLLPMIVLLVAGIPMYMCASASTPIAAALLAKGVSPGAALVFMLAGPATNAATVLLLMGTFGRRFVKVYLFSVVVGALAAGLLLDAVMGGVMPDLSLIDGGETAPGLWSVLLSLLLAVLLVRSLTGGAWLAGMAELRAARQRMANELPVLRRVSKRGVTLAVAILAIVGYLATGIRVVPPESKGYGFLFGELYRADLGPGLHYVPPAPFGWWEVRWASYPRKSDIGFATDLEMLERRRDLARMAPRGDWHSPVAAMNPRPAQATFLTADENLVEMSFSVHYSLSDASKFFYGVDHREDFVNLYAESVARELVATAILDDLLTELRPDIETQIATALQAELDKASLGVDIRSIQIVDLHPPGDAVHAFRDVSSALEDRETAIHRSHGRVAQSVPRARGNAMGVVADAEAAAEKSRLEASGRSSSFTALVEPYGRHPDLLGHLLWLETAERVLAGREKYIVPSDVSAPGVTLWRDRTPPIPIFTHEDP